MNRGPKIAVGAGLVALALVGVWLGVPSPHELSGTPCPPAAGTPTAGLTEQAHLRTGTQFVRGSLGIGLMSVGRFQGQDAAEVQVRSPSAFSQCILLVGHAHQLDSARVVLDSTRVPAPWQSITGRTRESVDLTVSLAT